MDIKPLEKIGLTKSEIKVYLSLLKLGQTTTGPIVDDSKVTRSKIYDILERLKNKGLVSHITKESTKYFSAADPNSILDYLDNKEKEIKKDKESIKDLLPQLILQTQLSKNKKIAEVFIGIKGMENAFNQVIKEVKQDEVFYAFGAGVGENVEQIKNFFNNLHRKRIKKKIKSKIIFNKISKGLFPSQEKSNIVQKRYLDITTPAAINIYKDFTLIAILNKDPITFIVKNVETANSFKEYFKVMWKIAKP
jgi:sugar-specific transcriptional regulator TrmB